jgi:adenosyl cobinamide kinase/adenosyl cobinamide phosphate guanylyltransferase
MPLVLLIGGARSGKSFLAVRLGRASGRGVVFVATAEPRDDEMAARIRRHRAERPRDWKVVEEPIDLRGAVEKVGPDAFVVVDCLSLWVANLLELGWSPEAIEDEAGVVAVLAAGRKGSTVAVTNEVGLGIVPATPLGRAYRDALGCVNAVWAAAADEAALVVAGRLLPLTPAEAAFLGLDE